MPTEEAVDYLVIGAGPAGLQAGYFLAKAGRSYLVVESGEAAGAFFTRFPRHRTLISINKVHTGWDDPELRLRNDWNSLLSEEHEPLFTRRTPRYFPHADEMVGYLADFAATHGIDVRYGTRLVEITRPDDFVARDQHGNTFRAKRVIAATGVSLPNVPDFEGAELAERYDEFDTDPESFTGQRVLIVGRGNSAFETADSLIANAAVIHVAGAGSLKLAWRTHFVGHLRAVNNNFLDTYQLKSQNAILDGKIRRIRKDADGYHVEVVFERVNEIVKEIRYDRVVLATGFRFDASAFAPECRPELTINDRFPAQTETWESPNVPDLHFAGTITQVRDFKKSTSGFIHGFRYGVRALHRILEHRHHGVRWPALDLGTKVEAAVDEVVRRVNTSSALWQQFAFLGDVVLQSPDGSLRYAEEVPVDHAAAAVPRGDFGEVARHAVITLEYGADHDAVDPFDVTAGRKSQDDVQGLDGRYLHPVVRVYEGAELVGEHHVTENLENEWDSEAVHQAPLREFLSEHLGAPAPALS
ncbi:MULTISPECIES: NAD(P)-binding domain-containing protein [Actinosynnema]|uniref:NAD(P)-binding domain-containing protein n=1 Tax=Actinosynnema TaxID=40566 RepID=UPI0020A52224|nr:NAD(P)-binding domain-containing protein [Actinosynnema pretiosum]MCP2094899.1 putative flavoprotein CzcO associated with the cation diffusion facilitator CzcD [Actinosynnema pretiosum]